MAGFILRAPGEPNAICAISDMLLEGHRAGDAGELIIAAPSEASLDDGTRNARLMTLVDEMAILEVGAVGSADAAGWRLQLTSFDGLVLRGVLQEDFPPVPGKKAAPLLVHIVASGPRRDAPMVGLCGAEVAGIYLRQRKRLGPTLRRVCKACSALSSP